METKRLTDEQIALLNEPLPKEALKPHPTRSYLSVINAIYVTERLNKVFGIGQWQIRTEPVTTMGKMVVTKTTLDIAEYGIHYECFGGNDNADLGDAYKGATTDAITKIGSYLGIGAHVWKNDPYPTGAPSQPTQHELKVMIDGCKTIEDLGKLKAQYGDSISGDKMLKGYANEAYNRLKGGAK